MSAAEERLANDPTSELWGEHRSRYRFAIAASGSASGQFAIAASGSASGQFAIAASESARAQCTHAAAPQPLASGTAPRDGARDVTPLRWWAAAGDGGPPPPRTGEPAPLAGLVVLDVACGAGFGLDMLGHAGAWPIGVDYDGAALSGVRRARSLARLVRGDGTRLPLRDASIDLVVSFETIEHVPDATALVREVRRVLKPDGRLVLSTPNRAFGPPERHTANPFHVREFTAEELRDLLRASFAAVQLFGQRPSDAYRYVPFLMVERHNEPRALAWKLLARVPFGLRDRLARALSGRPFFPGEADYSFVPEACDGAHALVAVAC